MQELTIGAFAIALTAWLKERITGRVSTLAEDIILVLFPLLVIVAGYVAPLYLSDAQLSLAAGIIGTWVTSTGLVKYVNQRTAKAKSPITTSYQDAPTAGE